MKDLINSGPNFKVEYFEDESAGRDVYKTTYNVEPALKQAELARQRTPGREMREIAVIPPDVMDRAFKEGWFHDEKAWRRWLNNPDNSKYRVHKG